MKDNILVKLYISFFKIGLFTVGGGYAMLPMFQKELVDKHHWITDEDLVDFYAIAQTTPGVIAVNTATLVGYRESGVLGAISATLGLISPSIVIILFIASFFEAFSNSLIVQKAFKGIRVVVVVLILNSIYKLSKKAIINPYGLIIAVIVFISVAFLKVSPLIIIGLSGALGIILHLMNKNESREVR